MSWKAPNFFDGTHARSHELDQMFTELVGPYGVCETTAGEIVRIVSRLVHEVWNNGGGNARSNSRFYLNAIRALEWLADLSEDDSDVIRKLISEAKREPSDMTVNAFNEIVCRCIDAATSLRSAEEVK